MPQDPAAVPAVLTPRSSTIELRVRKGTTVALRFAGEGRELFVIPTPSSAKWAVTTLREGGGAVRFAGGSWRQCTARLVLDSSEAERARSAIRAKYGDDVWRRYFAGAPRVMALELGVAPHPPTSELRTQEEFDAVSATYQFGVEQNPFERYLKDRSARALLARLRGLDPLLEIGPGTGWETIPLLEAGHNVVAVDISPRMISELEKRAVAHGVAHRLETVRGGLSGLGAVLASWGPAAFAAAYSTFGPLNLESDLSPTVSALARILRPSGRLLVTSLNRPGILPTLWELAIPNPRGALARFGRRVVAPAIRYPLDVYPLRPREVQARFAPWFRLRSVDPISVLTPPFDSPRLRRLIGESASTGAQRLDRWLCALPGSACAAEWNLIELERTDPPSD